MLLVMARPADLGLRLNQSLVIQLSAADFLFRFVHLISRVCPRDQSTIKERLFPDFGQPGYFPSCHY